MTIEQIERTLQTVAESQADHGARLIRVEEAFQQVAVAIKQLTELATTTDGRLDSVEEAQVHTDARLDVLIDSQIQLTARVDTLTGDIAALTGRMDTLAAAEIGLTQRMDDLAATQIGLTKQMDALAEAQTRTDHQIVAVNGRFEKIGEMFEQLAQVLIARNGGGAK
jgi:chromosome segregation ATPase